MAFWRSSDVFGINYHFMRTPDSHNYFPGDPVSSPTAAKAEVALAVSVALNHHVAIKNMWERGIVPIESRIMQEFNRYRFVQARGVRYGVHLIGTMFESIGTQPVQRGYHSVHVEGTYANFDMAMQAWKAKDKLLPAKPGLKIAFYHIWALRS